MTDPSADRGGQEVISITGLLSGDQRPTHGWRGLASRFGVVLFYFAFVPLAWNIAEGDIAHSINGLVTFVVFFSLALFLLWIGTSGVRPTHREP